MEPIEMRDGVITDQPDTERNTTPKQKWKVRNRNELLVLLRQINAEMIEEKIVITARSIMAGLKITERFDIVLPFIGFPFEAMEEPSSQQFGPREVALEITRYFEALYGEKLKVNTTIGRVAFPLRGDFYALRCPTTFGTVQFFCEPRLFGQDRSATPSKCNVVDLVEHMTPSLAHSLTPTEVLHMGAVLVSALGVFNAIRVLKEKPLIMDALGDYDAATLHLVANRKHPGLSQWASSQAVEKMLKAFLQACEVDYGRTHNLSDLFSLAQQEGLPAPPEPYIKDVSCSAGVRYGTVPVSTEQALRAHLVSMELGECIAGHIGLKLNIKTPRVSQPMIDDIPMQQWLKDHEIVEAIPANQPH